MGHNKIEHTDNELGSQKTTYDMHWILEHTFSVCSVTTVPDIVCAWRK